MRHQPSQTHPVPRPSTIPTAPAAPRPTHAEEPTTASTAATTAARTALTAVASLAALTSVAACGGAADDAAEQVSPTSAETADEAPATDAATDDAATDAATEEAATDGSTNASTDATSPYLDGAYSATGAYVSPGGRQNIDITLTLADGVVTEVEATQAASDPNSELYQEKFISGVADVVVGVALDELAVDKVAGSSLTSGGFADAVEQIKEQARA